MRIVHGTNRADTLIGTLGVDVFYGLDGHDVIYADAGNDMVYAGLGNDVVYGGVGDDRLFGEAGDDRLLGEAGNDTLDGGHGNDTLDGGHGHVAVWRGVSHYDHLPEACLVNYYRQGAKMGLHRDEDEEDFAAPVVSISLGDTAVFRIGGTERGGKTETLKLSSGDVLVMGGASRLCYHGVDRILTGTSTQLKEGGRINLTLRRVTKP